MHDIDSWMFFKWVFKAMIAVYLVTNTFQITMAVFDIGQQIVSSAAEAINGDTSIDISSTIVEMRTGMEQMNLGELLQLSLRQC